MALTLDDKLKSARIINQVAGVEDLPDWSRGRYRQEDINPQGGNRGEGPTHQKEEQLSIPGLPLELAHDFWDGQSLSDKLGAVWDGKDNQWLLPPKSPNGDYYPAPDEIQLMIEEDRGHRDQYDQNTPHPHKEGWDQANLYMGEQIPNNFDRILNPTGIPNPPRPSLDQLREGVKEKRRTGGIQMADASAANKITPISPWRTRLKDDPRHVKELYDPITGLSMSDWKRQGG